MVKTKKPKFAGKKAQTQTSLRWLNMVQKEGPIWSKVVELFKLVQVKRTLLKAMGGWAPWFWTSRKRTGTQKHWRPGLESETWSFSKEVGWNIFCCLCFRFSPKISRSFIKNRNESSCFWRYEPFFKHKQYISICLSRVYIYQRK